MPRVLILSAAMGAGHDGVAYELQRRLVARGAEATVVDYLELLPGRMGPFYRGFYAGQLRYAPASYEWLYGKIDRGVLSPVARWLGQQGKRQVRKLARDYDVVVSTYPLGCQAAGALRKRGKLAIPAVGFLTDVDVHGLWLHEGIDHNFTVWHGSAVEAINRVGVPSQAVGPVLPDHYLAPGTTEERAIGRELLGVAEGDSVVLVVAGSWGVGDIAGTARLIRDAGAGVPVVLCGRNEALRKELDNEPGVVAIGWTDQVRRLLAASDAVVHNAGGLSCLEGFAVGVPVIGYACLPGHGHRNSLAMQLAGVAADAGTEGELISEIRRLAGTAEGAAMATRARELFVSDPTDQLLELAGSTATMPVRSAARTWTARIAAVGIAVPATMGSLSFGVAEAANLGHGVAHRNDAVYVAAILDHQQVGQPAVVAALKQHVITAAVGTLASSPTPTDITALQGQNVSVIGLDLLKGSRNPKRLMASIKAAGAAVKAAGDEDAKVACIGTPGFLEHLQSWFSDVNLAFPKLVIRGGDVIPGQLKLGDQVLLDEQGRTPSQVTADLGYVTRLLHNQGLREQPMRALWSSP
ncbi:MAG: monogalactosyldiacylglycerol synthase [Frankiales bacterium]|nr:monogalactosyldiacylglycerol synthase [Frankiales bacterium]